MSEGAAHQERFDHDKQMLDAIDGEAGNKLIPWQTLRPNFGHALAFSGYRLVQVSP